MVVTCQIAASLPISRGPDKQHGQALSTGQELHDEARPIIVDSLDATRKLAPAGPVMNDDADPLPHHVNELPSYDGSAREQDTGLSDSVMEHDAAPSPYTMAHAAAAAAPAGMVASTAQTAADSSQVMDSAQPVQMTFNAASAQHVAVYSAEESRQHRDGLLMGVVRQPDSSPASRQTAYSSQVVTPVSDELLPQLNKSVAAVSVTNSELPQPAPELAVSQQQLSHPAAPLAAPHASSALLPLTGPTLGSKHTPLPVVSVSNEAAKEEQPEPVMFQLAPAGAAVAATSGRFRHLGGQPAAQSTGRAAAQSAQRRSVHYAACKSSSRRSDDRKSSADRHGARSRMSLRSQTLVPNQKRRKVGSGRTDRSRSERSAGRANAYATRQASHE